jgi:competence protein ComEC
VEKPKFFETSKSFVVTILILTIFIILRLFYEYGSYIEFTTKPFYFTYADVLNSYEKRKNGKVYKVLKLQSDDGFVFYTTSHRKENFSHKRLRLEIFPDENISFQDYLGIFYVKSRIRKVEELPYELKDKIYNSVSKQHQNSDMQSFYKALFFATPIDSSLREKIARLGVSHLVALSGFHLGILWGLVYGLFMLIYKPLQQRFFPYRHALFDMGILTMGVLYAYLYFVGSPPSLLRAYAMAFAGWISILMGIELISFTFLVTLASVLVLLFPELLVSLSFWLSISGVFYIFLILKYVKDYSRKMVAVVFIPIGIFMLMLPVVHSVFGTTSSYQLLSPFLSLLFVPFYPIMMFLHLIGMGGLFDGMLLWLFALPKEGTESFLYLWQSGLYLLLSLIAIWSRKAFNILLFIALSYAIYLFI